MEIVDNNFLRQFETKIGGGLAIIEYSVQVRKIFLTKIFVPEILCTKLSKTFRSFLFNLYLKLN